MKQTNRFDDFIGKTGRAAKPRAYLPRLIAIPVKQAREYEIEHFKIAPPTPMAPAPRRRGRRARGTHAKGAMEALGRVRGKAGAGNTQNALSKKNGEAKGIKRARFR